MLCDCIWALPRYNLMKGSTHVWIYPEEDAAFLYWDLVHSAPSFGTGAYELVQQLQVHAVVQEYILCLPFELQLAPLMHDGCISEAMAFASLAALLVPAVPI